MRTADTLRFLSTLTLRKVLNASAVWSSFQLTRLLRRPVQWGLPMTISIEPTTACNLRCPECPSGLRSFTRATGNLRQDFFRQVIDELEGRLLCLIFYFQGEPYIHPGFLDMVRHAHDRGLYTITSTNGHFLDPENARRTVASGLDRIIISVDGATRDVYAQYRKEGNLDTVLDGARNLVQARREAGATHPHIIFQMLIVRPNEHQIEDVRRIAREIGVDEVRLKSAQIYSFAQGNPLIPTIGKYSRYAQDGTGRWHIKHKLLNQCWKLWHACVITWDGQVVPCCFDKDARHRLGDLRQATFRSVWTGAAYRRFRAALLGGRDKIDICTNCTEGCSPWK